MNKELEFTFKDAEEGRIVAEDKEGYGVSLNLGHLSEKTEGNEHVEAAWENIICPIIYKELFDSDSESSNEGHEVEMDIESCVDKLSSALNDDNIDTGSITDKIEEDAFERHTRLLVEYLINQDVLEYENGRVQLLQDRETELQESDFMGAGKEVTNLFLKWTGTLEIMVENLNRQYEYIESQLEKLEDKVETKLQRREKLEQKIQDARSELYDICGGDVLYPEERTDLGMVEEPPEEIEDEARRKRYKDKYDQIIRLENMLPDESSEVLGGAKKELSGLLEAFEDREEEINFHMDDLRTQAYLIYSTNNLDIEEAEQLLENMQEFTVYMTDCLASFRDATQCASDISNAEVFGIVEGEKEETAFSKTEDHLEDAKQQSENVKEKSKDTKDVVGQPSPTK